MLRSWPRSKMYLELNAGIKTPPDQPYPATRPAVILDPCVLPTDSQRINMRSTATLQARQALHSPIPDPGSTPTPRQVRASAPPATRFVWRRRQNIAAFPAWCAVPGHARRGCSGRRTPPVERERLPAPPIIVVRTKPRGCSNTQPALRH